MCGLTINISYFMCIDQVSAYWCIGKAGAMGFELPVVIDKPKTLNQFQTHSLNGRFTIFAFLSTTILQLAFDLLVHHATYNLLTRTI